MTSEEILRILETFQDSAKRQVEMEVDSGPRSEAVAKVKLLDEIIGCIHVKHPESVAVTNLKSQRTETIALTAKSPSVVRRSSVLSKDDIEKLRNHVINLNQGQFSGDGLFQSSKSDVDRIFEHLLQDRIQTKGKLRILFFAHGGLVDEAAGLVGALRQVDWWLANDVYPIFFIWEAGVWDALEQLLTGIQFRVAAAVGRSFTDRISDPVVERLVRFAGGPAIWASMKRSAEMASFSDADGSFEGGAYYVVLKLKDFCQKNSGLVELHAIGHSAGSIFQAHFVQTAMRLGTPQFETVQLLAPAITVDAFETTLFNSSSPLIGTFIKRFIMYSMKQVLEEQDNCAGVYHKSLLYLIRYALEKAPKAEILGLEECVRRNSRLTTLFESGGDDADREYAATAVWAKTVAETGRKATRSTSHSGFDDDHATMESVMREVLNITDEEQIISNPNFVDGGRSMNVSQLSFSSRFNSIASLFAETSSFD